MPSEYVIAVYRPKAGKEEDLQRLLSMHQPLLAREGLGADRRSLVMRSPTDGTYVELLEWLSEDAAREAHDNDAVMSLWRELGRCADQLTLADLPEAANQFPHFEVVGRDGAE